MYTQIRYALKCFIIFFLISTDIKTAEEPHEVSTKAIESPIKTDTPNGSMYIVILAVVCSVLAITAFVSIMLNVLQWKRRRQVSSQLCDMSSSPNLPGNSADHTDYGETLPEYVNVERGGEQDIEAQISGYQTLSLQERATSGLYTSLRKDRPP